MNNPGLSFVVALVAVIIAIGSYFHAVPSFGAASGQSHFQKESFLQGLAAGVRDQFSVDNLGKVTIGASGTAVTQLLKGTCSLIGDTYTVIASTTKAFDCAVTGALTGDLVFPGNATSTVAGLGWENSSGSASSTAGFITIRVSNSTGANAVIPASVASSTPYFILR